MLTCLQISLSARSKYFLLSLSIHSMPSFSFLGSESNDTHNESFLHNIVHSRYPLFPDVHLLLIIELDKMMQWQFKAHLDNFKEVVAFHEVNTGLFIHLKKCLEEFSLCMMLWEFQLGSWSFCISFLKCILLTKRET